jgi:5-formyltetrahydrofolate cyclo-ligase
LGEKGGTLMNTQTMKQSLRQSIIAARQKMTPDDRAEFSRAITARILDLSPYKSAKTVLAYMSFGAEFDTGAWVRQALQDDKQVLLPKVNSSTRQLELYRLENVQLDLAPGLWGIPEPLAERCDRVDELAIIDFILLPGVAFARDGARLGYGGGFYDKLLARVSQREGNPTLVAAAFAMQLVKEIPQEATDRKVEWLFTENEVIHCSS